MMEKNIINPNVMIWEHNGEVFISLLSEMEDSRTGISATFQKDDPNLFGGMQRIVQEFLDNAPYPKIEINKA